MIYIVTDDSGYVKIGVATNVAARVKELQCGNPRTIRLVKTIRINGGNDYKVEHALHKRYESARVETSGTKSEWFEIDGISELLNANRDEMQSIVWECGGHGKVTIKANVDKTTTPISVLVKQNYLPSATYNKIFNEGIETVEELKEITEQCKDYVGFGIDGIGEIRARQIVHALKTYFEDAEKANEHRVINIGC